VWDPKAGQSISGPLQRDGEASGHASFLTVGTPEEGGADA